MHASHWGIMLLALLASRIHLASVASSSVCLSHCWEMLTRGSQAEWQLLGTSSRSRPAPKATLPARTRLEMVKSC
ncbi:hypothetical protein BDW66DRAFT_129020 [Aspergillus desertorum]